MAWVSGQPNAAAILWRKSPSAYNTIHNKIYKKMRGVMIGSIGTTVPRLQRGLLGSGLRSTAAIASLS